MPRPRRSNPIIMHRAGELRHELTPAERKLWARLRNDQLGVSFRRQHAIDHYVTDFCCISHKLIVEVDGGQHADQVEYDEERTRFLESQGYRVIRFWNNQVMNHIDSVLETILVALTSPKFAQAHLGEMPQAEGAGGGHERS